MAEKPSELNKLDAVSVAGADSNPLVETHTGDNRRTESDRQELSAYSDGDVEKGTEDIKAQIEETRSNLGVTIDAIQDKLSFSNISEQVSEQVNNAIETAKDNVYEATIGKAVNFMKNTGNEISRSSLITTARDNPLPFVLIGIGAGLLAYNGFGKRHANPKHLSFDRHAGENRSEHSDSVESKRSIMTSAQETVSGLKDSVSSAAGTAYDGVSSAAASTYSGAAGLANGAYEKAGEFGTKAQETYSQYLEEKPWAIGAVALIAGAAVGLAIPSTHYEGELMGEARVNLMSKAKDTASDLVDKAKQVASDAGKTISDEVKTATQDVLNS